MVCTKNPHQRYGVLSAILDHSVTCHLTPRLNPRQAGRYYLSLRDGKLSWCCATF